MFSFIFFIIAISADYVISNQVRELMIEDDNICFSKIPTDAYPQILGGTSGDSIFNCLSIDSASNTLILGGYSQSIDIVDILPSPILLRLDLSSGIVKWHNQIQGDLQLNPTSIDFCDIQETQKNYIIGLSSLPQFSVLIFDFQTGGLLNKYFIHDPSDESIIYN
ncbi:UNKNOWN [Stylonychia lemnae]|uniref:Uncharacterized protein n=1 Tax=Stylonychia lemnae TaxID=5949 RepID=A0A078A9K2_STYLE|nr:UNKNOWN [Stylonychia lemnae]|eukprot:CDW78945.1 UNKNOWN [Stylonychia lemnae]